MVGVICLVLLPLAVAWGTWLIVDASITLPLRQWVLRRSGGDGWFITLVHCPNCTAFWVSAGLSIPTWLALSMPAWATPLAVLAMAQLAPMILTVADRIATIGAGGD